MLMFLINSIMLSCSVWVFIDKATCGYFFGPFLALFVVSRTISLRASVARSRQSKRLLPLRSWVRFSLRTHVKRVS
jgi:hypothetical protein